MPYGNCRGIVHMEEEVQDRVQVEVGREEQGVGETHGKEQGEEQREQTLKKHGWPRVWDDAHKHVLEPRCECDDMCKVQEKKWRVRCSCLHTVGYSRLLSAVNETYCNQINELTFHELHQLMDVSLRVNFLAASHPRIQGHMVLLSVLQFCRVEHHGNAPSWSRSAGKREHPVVVCLFFGWFASLPRSVRSCSKSLLDSNREDIENIAHSELFRITRVTLHCPFHESSLSNCQTLFCCKSAWSASRWGWLVIFLTSSWTRRFSAYSGTLKSLSISSMGFGWICWESSVLPATSESNWKSSEEVEVTQKLTRLWFLHVPSWWLSGDNKLGVFRQEWLRSIVFDRTSILSSEQVWCRPNTPCFDISSTLSACIVQDAVLPGHFCSDLCVPCS